MLNKGEQIAQEMFLEAQLPGQPRQKVIDSPHLHKMQRMHFFLFDVLPIFGTVCAIVLLFFHPISVLDLTLFAVFWALSGLGISIGYHRLFTHRSFKASAPVRRCHPPRASR